MTAGLLFSLICRRLVRALKCAAGIRTFNVNAESYSVEIGADNQTEQNEHKRHWIALSASIIARSARIQRLIPEVLYG